MWLGRFGGHVDKRKYRLNRPTPFGFGLVNSFFRYPSDGIGLLAVFTYIGCYEFGPQFLQLC
jgi:hypothetical protein